MQHTPYPPPLSFSVNIFTSKLEKERENSNITNFFYTIRSMGEGLSWPEHSTDYPAKMGLKLIIKGDWQAIQEQKETWS